MSFCLPAMCKRRCPAGRAVGFRVVTLLSIPSPGDPFIVNSGPIHARWYGLLLALGVLLAGWIARREFRRRGMDPELAYTIAVWGVPAVDAVGGAPPELKTPGFPVGPPARTSDG